jgi:NADPH:quinone reductase-like Zn-dependent oxidoreductase
MRRRIEARLVRGSSKLWQRIPDELGLLQMRVIELRNAPGLDNLAHAERPDPVPKDDEVVVRVAAASLNYRDLEIVQGTYAVQYRFPLIPLSDGVGRVADIGKSVTQFRVGDRVAGTFWQGWVAGDPETPSFDSSLGGPLDGMLAEFATFREYGLVRVPEHLSDEEASTLPCAAVTAWYALITRGHLKAGETVLIQGTGGVALFALQFAKMSGARAIVLSSSDDKLKRVRDLGADAVVNYSQVPEWHNEVLALTGGRGVDHAMELGGPGTFAKTLQAIRLGGQVNVIGYLGGKSGELNPLLILQRRAIVRGISVGSRAAFEAMNAAIGSHCMRPVLDRIFPWADTTDAFRYLKSARHFGKVVIHLQDSIG